MKKPDVMWLKPESGEKQECQVCGKLQFPVIHSCSNFPQTRAAEIRWGMDVPKLPKHILLQGVVGSTAYGMSTDTSDVDRGGIYAADPLYLLDLQRTHPEEPSYTQKAPLDDLWLHEAKKMLRLQLNGNPTACELLWLDDYEIITPEGQALIKIRRSFMSSIRVREAYLAFARGQLRRFFGYDRETDDGRKHAAKNARHLWRLLYQGYRAYMGDGIIVRLPEQAAKDALEFGERAAAGEIDLVEHEINRYTMLFDSVKSPLPETPDNLPARRWLLELRASMLMKGFSSKGI